MCRSLCALGLSSLPAVAWGSSEEPAVLDLQRGQERFQINLNNPEGYAMASYLLRDTRSGRQGIPDPDLLRLAAWAQAVMAEHVRYTVFRVTSGLRTPESNMNTESAARNSRHLPDAQGHFFAMDVEPIGAGVEKLAGALVNAGFGGVGVYESHVHFDVRESPVFWRKTKKL